MVNLWVAIKVMKLKLTNLVKQDESEQPKTLRKEEMVKLTGGYTYLYTGCTNTGNKGDCTDGKFD